ncbi:FecR family protein [Arcicella rosea]|uniref:Ferric-dicitrate binding protein FerR (Iron transport regulator) n=1 Tax=Arcicella rosea TaxID=502909 RepID=A0A841EUS7_9BACT|nr:FecR family protein [Arcicella rosea]MBB6004060.1 ferric-dicitrate binding protein FerR (iron transport regulator) [Arcicella rosea]
MKKYNDYTVLDFLVDKTFVQWVRSSGHKNPDDFWTKWVNENPHHHTMVQQASDFILASGIEGESVSDFQVELLINKTLSTINTVNNRVPIKLRVFQHREWLLKLVASVALFLTIGFATYLWQKNISEKLFATKNNQKLIEKENLTSYKMPVQLPDGSTVLLQPNSSVSFPETFQNASNREVYLKGQAFFEVVKNAKHPFLVYAKEVTVKVLGTSFTVQAFTKSTDVKVVVKTGKVMVFPKEVSSLDDTSNTIILLPNQQVIVNNESHKINQSPIQPAQVKAITSGSTPTIEFNDVPIKDIFHKLESMYGITIYFDEKLLGDCSLTTSLADEPLFEKLKLICEAIGPNSHFEVVNGKIVIHSQGCNQ